MLDLARWADVVIEGFAPGVTERLGPRPEALRGANPRADHGLDARLFGHSGAAPPIPGFGNMGAAHGRLLRGHRLARPAPRRALPRLHRRHLAPAHRRAHAGRAAVAPPHRPGGAPRLLPGRGRPALPGPRPRSTRGQRPHAGRVGQRGPRRWPPTGCTRATGRRPLGGPRLRGRPPVAHPGRAAGPRTTWPP